MTSILDLMDRQHSNTLKVVETALKGISGASGQRVPISQIQDFGHQSCQSAGIDQSGRSQVIHPGNPDAAREMNFNPPINWGLQGDMNNIDLSKIKKNMVSGRDRTSEGIVMKQTYWPHNCLSKASRHILGKTKPQPSSLRV